MTNPSQADELLYEERGPVALITFNRPQARNALTFYMYDKLAEICAGMKLGGPIRAIVVTGAGGKAFAAGTDISQFRVFETPEQGLKYERDATERSKTIAACPVPLIAAISGACTGGGAGIAANCDIRLATKDLRFGFPIARTLGNMLSAATLGGLVAHFGESRVKRLLYTSELMGADEALATGFISELHEDHEAVLARALELAGQIASNAPLTIYATKELLRRRRYAGPEVEDADLVAKVYTSEDFKEGMDAFLNKRKPQWKGR
jgi:enoyl-CoA hydratase/carnithine racemase